MDRYKNLSGNSGVVAYELGEGGITVQFSGGWLYLYTNQSAGTSNIAEMQRLALSGRGLNGFIDRVVRKAYAKKWR